MKKILLPFFSMNLAIASFSIANLVTSTESFAQNTNSNVVDNFHEEKQERINKMNPQEKQHYFERKKEHEERERHERERRERWEKERHEKEEREHREKEERDHKEKERGGDYKFDTHNENGGEAERHKKEEERYKRMEMMIQKEDRRHKEARLKIISPRQREEIASEDRRHQEFIDNENRKHEGTLSAIITPQGARAFQQEDVLHDRNIREIREGRLENLGRGEKDDDVKNEIKD